MFFRLFSTRSRACAGVIVAATLAIVTFWHSPAFAALPELPRVYLDTTYVPPAGRTIFVPAGGNFQSAIDNAQPGDTISLEAGATFTGNFTLPNKGSNQWIVIRSSASDLSLPPPGTRVKPSDAYLLPKIVSPDTNPAIRTNAAANRYRFIGVEIATTHSTTASNNYNVVLLGNGSETSIAELPSDIVFDRCYIHGTRTGSIWRGIALNGVRLAVIDSHLADFHALNADTQAILSWNGPGPYKIVNNYLEGAGENVMFGGASTRNTSMIPSDIEVRNNYFHKPLSWREGDPAYAGIHWWVKNLFELKIAQRVLIEGNIFENNWEDQQFGFAILFTPRNADGAAPWTVVQDVTFRGNIVRHSASGVVLLGRDSPNPSDQLKRVLIQDNLFEDISYARWGWSQFGWLFEIHDGAADITIDHNTGFQNGAVIHGNGAATTGLIYINNITPHNQDGIIGNGTSPGLATLASYFPGAILDRTVLAGGNAASYPPSNFFPSSLDNVGFVDLSGGDYRLGSSSPYNNAGTDGTDIGADIDALLAATANVSDGVQDTTPPPTSTDTKAPSISSVAAPLVTSSGATVTWTTNESSDSQVEYGLTTSYGGSTTVNASMVTSHSQALSGLAANKVYHYRVKSKDASGNLARSSDKTFTTPAAPDVTPPIVSITAPLANVTVKGKIKVSAKASDNVGIAGVQFKLDGQNLGSEDTSAGYSVTWSTSRSSNGLHTLTAVARDKAGNVAMSVPVIVTVVGGTGATDPLAPTISNVAATGITTSAATVAWTTNEASDSQVEYAPTTAYGTSAALNATIVTTHSQSLSGLNSNTLYHYRVKSRDVRGNLAVSADFTFTTLGATPFSGVAALVPGIIEAEDFDKGGEGVAYHDTVSGNAGGQYRPNEDVDIIADGTGYVVNDIQAGEWLSYTINVTQAAAYRIETNLSSALNNSKWRIEIDGVNKTGSIAVPNTGGWQAFQYVGAGVVLTAGLHVLKIVSEQEYFNLDSIRVVVDPAGGTPQNVVWTNLVGVAASGNSLQMTTCDGCPAGATSQQQIVSGDGYLEFTASEYSRRSIGLSRGNPGTTADEINFAVGLWADGGLDIRESGVYRMQTTFVTGDIVRVAVEAGVVKYYKNGNVIYTSTVAPTYPLLIDTALLTPFSTITNAVISGAP